VKTTLQFTPAEHRIPEKPSYSNLKKAAAQCTACPLYLKGTQTVFGAGPVAASLVFVGEQPGNEEDLAGKPFVGPAGRMLEKALQDADLPKKVIYVTNAVKHFKWFPKGNKRIHEKPNGKEIKACLPWLKAELTLVQPKILVCLGATAAQAVFGKKITIKNLRGRFVKTDWAPDTYVTVHPSSLLRNPDPEDRRKAYREFVADLRKIARRLGGL